MVLKRIQLVAQVVGFAGLIVLSVFGVLALASDKDAGPEALAQASLTGVPLYINYQGTLKDPLGEPVTSVYTMTVSVYDLPAGGTELWWEEHGNVTVREGRFSVILGDGSSSSGDLTPSLFSVPERYIALTVDGVEMEPRQRFVSVAYAFQAWQADQADQADQANQANRAYGLSAADGDPADAVVVDDAGSVGIGTQPHTWTRPVLHNKGDYYGHGHVFLYAYGGDGFTRRDGTAYIQARDNYSSVLSLQFRTQNGSQVVNAMILTATGDVGIGTGNPQAKLDVSGDAHISGDLTVDGSTNTKLTVSGPYSVVAHEGTKDQTMTPSANSVCFLTRYHHNTYGNGEDDEHGSCMVYIHSDNYWHLGAENRPAGFEYTEVWCEARCLSW